MIQSNDQPFEDIRKVILQYHEFLWDCLKKATDLAADILVEDIFKDMKRLYDSVIWREARKRYLNEHPFCVMCRRRGVERRATVVDHIVDHKGDLVKFWDESNWQSLCATDHSGTKRVQTNHGYSQATDASGFPVDPGQSLE